MLLANRYQVIKKLGEGGFGQTFLAQDIQMPSHRACVIKQLKPITTNPEVYQLIRERFQREATVLERLGERSPQIPTLYAYFCENKTFFLIQEWIEGSTLRERVRTQTILSEGAVREILLNLLPVLEFIHSQGMVHRDIKPDNIIIRQADQMPVLIDFGAVRETMGTVVNSQGHPTQSIVIGTPGFMSSEQAAGRPIASSDLYSLGLTAIYAVTGRMPQDFTTDPQSGEILWRNHAPHLSAEFADILEKATRSHPRDRYSSASQMLAALQGGVTLRSLPPTQSTSLPVTLGNYPEPYVPSSPLPDAPPLSPPITQAVTQPVTPPSRLPSGSNLFSIALMIGGLIGTILLVGVLILQPPSSEEQPAPAEVSDHLPLPELPDLQVESSPSPPFDRTDPTASVPNSSTSQNVGQANSPSDTPEPTGLPLNVLPPENETPPEPAPPIAEPISATFFLVSSANSTDDRVNIYAQPSIQADSPHYGLMGDRVIALQQIQAEDGYTWYFVQFPSGANGWVRSDAVRSEPPSPEPEPPLPPEPPGAFPRPALIIGQVPRSRVNVRSAPSTRTSAPHYGLVGDRVTVLEQAQGDDGRTWYLVQFPSGATGWIRGDLIELQ